MHCIGYFDEMLALKTLEPENEFGLNHPISPYDKGSKWVNFKSRKIKKNLSMLQIRNNFS